MRVPKRLRHSLNTVSLAVFVAFGLLTSGCQDKQNQTVKGQPNGTSRAGESEPKDDDAALTITFGIDGRGTMTITHGEIRPLIKHLREFDPRVGADTCAKAVFEHFIQLSAARDEFAEQRAEFLRRAQSQANALGASAGYDDFAERTKNHPELERLDGVQHPMLPIPEAAWLFDDENVGMVSPILETAQGFSLAVAQDRLRGVTKAYDKVEGLVIRYYHHRAKAHGKWLAELRDDLHGLAPGSVKVHSAYRDALPDYLNRAR